ncbi:hypothetical protein FRB94_000308 [Tulasnella sp. JGI-2019a]|nr:hypothetical protein FRB93_003203 [Tulasnella sp. JGI-2019a]KAG9006897.1 hypothetical protein FRB94_000308 [Tulasnella sp. JGI-2019a]
MTDLKLYGNNRFPYCQMVKVVAYEKEVDIVVEIVDMSKGAHKEETFLQKQPFGQVPYLDDNGFILFQARAIGRYIALKYANQGTNLLPNAADIKAVALFEQAINTEQAEFDPHAGGIVTQKTFMPRMGKKTDEEQLKRHVEVLNAKLDAFEKILSKQEYLSGNEIGLADLFTLPYGTMLEEAFPGFLQDPARPKVTAWWTKFSNRPSWKRVMIEAEA